MATVPITGLSGLGRALADTGADYLGRTRQLEDEQRRRAALLTDVAAQEARADTRYNRARTDQLADVESAREREDKVSSRRRREQLFDTQEARDNRMVDEQRQLQQSLAIALVKEQLLAPADINNPERVNAAWEEAHRRGLEEKVNARRAADDAATRLVSVRRGIENAMARANTPPRQFTQNDREVRELAERLAGTKNVKEIEARIPDAIAQLNYDSVERHKLVVQNARQEAEVGRYTEAQLTDVIQQVMQTFHVVPNTPPPSGMLAEPTADAGAPTTLAQPRGLNDAAINTAFGAPPAQSPMGTPRPAALQDPLADAEASGLFTRPMTQQGRSRIFAPTTPEIMDTASQSLQAELARLQSSPPTRATAGRVAYLNDILNRLGTKRQEMLGVPAVPTPTAAPPPTPGAMFSDPYGAPAAGARIPQLPRWMQPQGAPPAFGF